MVTRDHVVQDGQFIPLLGLVQPLQIAMAILRELQEELPLMASMSNMPDVPWDIMSFCSRHMHSEKNALFAPKKLNIGRF